MRVGGDLRAVGEMHVAVEIRLLDGAEARLRRRRSGVSDARDALDRRDASAAPRASRDTRRCRRMSRSAGRRRARPWPTSVAERMRLAGASPSAGRSTWTFSVAFRLVTVVAVGRHRDVDRLAGDARPPALRRSPGSCTTAFSIELRALQRASVVGVGQIDVARRHRLRAAAVAAAVMRLLPRSCSVLHTLRRLRVRRMVISSASMIRPSAVDVRVPGQPHVVLGARHAGGAGSRLERSLPLLVRRDGDVRLVEQPEHFAIAIVGRADAGALHAARA